MSYLGEEIYDTNQYPHPPKKSYNEEVEYKKALYHLKQEKNQLLANIRFREAQLVALNNPNSISMSREHDLLYEEDCSQCYEGEDDQYDAS